MAPVVSTVDFSPIPARREEGLGTEALALPGWEMRRVWDLVAPQTDVRNGPLCRVRVVVRPTYYQHHIAHRLDGRRMQTSDTDHQQAYAGRQEALWHRACRCSSCGRLRSRTPG